MNDEALDVMTYDEARYVGVGSVNSTDIQLMNIGFTKADESANPTEKAVQYVGDKSKTNKVTGYDTQIAIESDLIKNENVVEDFYDIFYYRKTGTEAQRYIYLVDLWKPAKNGNGTVVENTYKARKLKTSVVIGDKTSTPGETIKFSGNLKGIGDFVYGTFNTLTKSFTENEQEQAEQE